MTYEQLGTYLTQFLIGYVVNVVQIICVALGPLALSLLTIYVANYGYAVARGEVDEPIGVFGWKMFKIAMILAFALVPGTYMSLVANTIEGLQDGMATLFISGGAGGPFGGGAPGSAWKALDTADQKAWDIITGLWAEGGILRLDLIAAAIIFHLAVATFLLIGGAVVLISKMFMYFALTLGPAAILSLMFRPTAKFFDAWLGVALSAVVMSWFVFFAIGLALFLNDKILAGVLASNAFVPGAASTVHPVSAAVSSLVIYALLALLLWQAPRLASALTGGPAMSAGMASVTSYVLGRASAGSAGGGGGSSGGSNKVAPGGAAYHASRAGGYAYQQVSRLFGGERR